MGDSLTELYYWRFYQNITEFEVTFDDGYYDTWVKYVDLWVHFATQLANVEHFTVVCVFYELPQFVYKSASLRTLNISRCLVRPSRSVIWTNLVSLSISFPSFISDDVMEKILSGCPNLEMLKLRGCLLNRLEISSPKLRELIIEESFIGDDDPTLCLEIFAPFVRNLHILDTCNRILLRDVASLLTARLYLKFDFEYEDDKLEKELKCLKELLEVVAHVENLELGPWCIEGISILELKGWQFPPSSRKFLKLKKALEQVDFPGICSFLQSSSDLETLVIDWYAEFRYKQLGLLSRYTNEDEHSRRFETRKLNCSFLHLKTIKISNSDGSLSSSKFVLPLAKYVLKNAIVLEKFIIDARYSERHDGSSEYVKMEEELRRFPRSSPHASVIFSY